MLKSLYSCEKRCPCQYIPSSTQFIVITGGPGAGKTAVLEFVRKVFCEHVAILPEAASILFSGGFWRLESPSAQIAVQKAIFYVQTEMQSLVLNERKWAVGLCDRGTLDGAAYWPGPEDAFCSELNTTVKQEYNKYIAVIHLSTPALKGGYNHQNPIRIETAEQAAIIDQKIHEIWKHHPNYSRIDSTGDFIEKVNRATLAIYSYLPTCCREHLNELLKRNIK